MRHPRLMGAPSGPMAGLWIIEGLLTFVVVSGKPNQTSLPAFIRRIRSGRLVPRQFDLDHG